MAAPCKFAFTFFVENPVSGDDIPLYRMPVNLLVETIVAIKRGGSGSFDWSLRHDPDASQTGSGTIIHTDTGVSNDTTGIIYSPPFSLAPALVPVGDWVWLELANVSTGLFRPVAVEIEMIGVEAS